MADTKTSAFTALTDPATSDGVPIIDDYGGSPAEKIITVSNLLQVINDFTEDTTPDRDADFVVSYDTSAAAVKKVLLNNLGSSVVEGGFSNTDPLDSSTYYFGSFPTLTMVTPTAATRRIYFQRACTITAVDVYIAVAGTLGTTETSTLSLRLNNTTDTTISTVMTMDANPYHELKTGLGIAIAAGDYVEFKWVTPAWVTNPTTLYGRCQILCE